jgi:hypothetical protein
VIFIDPLVSLQLELMVVLHGDVHRTTAPMLEQRAGHPSSSAGTHRPDQLDAHRNPAPAPPVQAPEC